MESYVGPRSRTGLDLCSTPANVLRLPRDGQRHWVLCLSMGSTPVDTIRRALKEEPVVFAEDLKNTENHLSCGTPDLIMIDSQIPWVGLCDLIRDLTEQLDIPIVLLVKGRASQRRKALLREAYAAGITDVVYEPLVEKELSETVQVLLRARRHARITRGA